MKAIITSKYGSVEVLQPQDVARPIIADDEILVQVHACSVNPIDWKVRRGDFKILTGRKPPRILGEDYAGIVAEVGSKITRYQPGDAVWGFVETFKRGTYAEFVKVKAEEIGPKPENLSFEETACLPLVGLTAYQALIQGGRLKKGDHILINGASGGVGLAGVQIAKARGCKVTGVCSTNNLQRTLKPGGIYVRTLPSFESLILGPLLNLIRAKKVRVLDCKASAKDLAILRDLVENGNLVPIIEKVYPLEQVRAAHTRSETGRVVGKLVLKVV
ncbi:MAG: NAD(P)-dependent alcohol dehydrogenase [Deltaproteobacteria bacterium]